MKERVRAQAPSVESIERRFRSIPVRVARPAITGGLSALQFVRGFRWYGEGLENLKKIQAPFIMAANHTSHADTAAILAVLPPQYRDRTCVAAALDVFGPAGGSARPIEVARRELLQIVVAAGFHAFAFDRQGSTLRSIRTASELIDQGWNLLLYPEGTRSRDGRIDAFKPGVGLLAKKTGRPVVPIHVNGGGVVLPCGRTLPQPGRIIARFGDPMHLRDGESTSDFVRRVQDAVQAMAPHDAAIDAIDRDATPRVTY